MKILFISGFAPIVSDPAASREFYVDKLGVPLDTGEGDYVFTDTLEGAKHVGLWPLRDAAESCFGTDTWPDDVAVPQATIEFEVADVEAAAAELVDAGLELVHPVKTEPWGQVIARVLSPDGLLIGVTWVPWHHEDEK